MSIRKRAWTTEKGETKTAWVVDYSDQAGKRRLKTFAKKGDAQTFWAKVKTEISAGIHSSGPTTVAQAGEMWLASREAAELERATLANYRLHLDMHIAPLIGKVKLADLTLPGVRLFEDRLRANGRSPVTVRKVLVSLSGILNDAQDRGTVAQNVMHRRRAKNGNEARKQQRLEVGHDIPTLDEMRAVIAQLKTGRERPLILTATFTGLRASELRGLRWQDVDLDRNELHVRQRADRFAQIGVPKSKAGLRSVPLLPMVVNALREWKLACPASPGGLVFPGQFGRPITLTVLDKFTWQAAQKRAGLVGGEGEAKYTGFHALRHFYASWCINRKKDGGLELPGKVVQERLGHSSITITMDVYGHLFPRSNDADELKAAETAFLAV